MQNDDQRKQDMARFEAEIRLTREKLPTHEKKEFTFTQLERQLLAQQVTIEKLAQQTQDLIINNICLQRLGITPSNQIHIRYSVGLGRFVVYLPKTTKEKTNGEQKENSLPQKNSDQSPKEESH